MEVNDKIDLSIHTLCSHDIPNFSLIFNISRLQFVKSFQSVVNLP